MAAAAQAQRPAPLAGHLRPPADLEPWAGLAGLFDEAWFVDCDIDEAMARVYARQTGHGVAPEVGGPWGGGVRG